MRREFETMVIGAGQAGLSVSYYLKAARRDHVVFEQAEQAAESWRNHRWDSFTLNTPNWQSQLAGGEIPGADPDGFLGRDEVVAYFEKYERRNHLPVRYGVQVWAVTPASSAAGYIVKTSAGAFWAKNVVVATGLYQKPRIPGFAKSLSPHIQQVHSDGYRNPSSLVPGAVLVVGSAQSGAQIAEELYQSRRKVYLSVSGAGRVPRRYRGKDINWWHEQLGMYEKRVDQLASPRAKFASKPHISGNAGGHTLNLHQFASDGVSLLGRILGAQGAVLKIASDLHENLAKADQFAAELMEKIDRHIERNALVFPQEELPKLTSGFEQPEIRQLDLRQVEINSVVWATGYSFDFSMVQVAAFDGDGFPIQRRGVTDYPGLYFVGLPWLHTVKSGLLFGVSEDAAHIASHILRRENRQTFDPPLAGELVEVGREALSE